MAVWFFNCKFCSPGIFTSYKYHTCCGQEKRVKKLPDEWHCMLWSDRSYPRHRQNGVRHEGSDAGRGWPSAQAAARPSQHRRLPTRLQVCTNSITHFWVITLSLHFYRFYCFALHKNSVVFMYLFVVVSRDYENSGIFLLFEMKNYLKIFSYQWGRILWTEETWLENWGCE